MNGKHSVVGVLWLVLVAAVCHPQGLADPVLSSPDGDPILWSAWTEEHGAAAVVMWGSWMPGSESVIGGLSGIRTVAAERGLDFVVVALQETREASAEVLGNSGLPWLHDRHGALLKVYRVYDIPAMVIVAADGSVLSKLEVSSQALQLWEGP